MGAMTLAGFAVCGYLMNQDWFYSGLGLVRGLMIFDDPTLVGVRAALRELIGLTALF